MEPAFRLIAFDFDGTLADTFPFFRRTLNEVAQAHRFRAFAPHELDDLRHLGPHELMRMAGMPMWKLPGVISHFRRLMSEAIDEIRLFEGVSAAVRQLADAGGIELAVVSSNSTRNVRRVLGPDLVSLFGHYRCGASMFGKGTRLRALAEKRAIDPAAAVYIGDELRDAEAAREAGWQFGAVGWGYAPLARLQQAAPAWVFDTPEDWRRLHRLG